MGCMNAPAETPLAHSTAPAVKNHEWHTVVADLVAAGRTAEDARCSLTRLLALQMVSTLLQNGRTHLALGSEMDAAMLAIAGSAVRDLPAKLAAAGTDQAAALEAVTATRARLKSSGSLLDKVHPRGRQPIFQGTDDILADFEEFLAPAS